jgi:D-inositol-3-phosphate glycosyltransferase
MKHIAMISYHTCPLASEEGKETGGMNVYVLELSRQLARVGDVVDIFTRSVDADNIPIVQVAPGLRVIHLVAGPQKMISKKELIPHIPDFIKSYQEFCQKEHINYDILHCHYYLSGLIGSQIQKHFIISFHTLALMKNLVARSEEEKEDVLRIEAERALITKSDRVIASSESEGNYLEYLYDSPKGKIVIIPPGVDTELFRPMNMDEAKNHIHMPSSKKLILFAGRIEPLKGIDVLMYAIKIVLTRNPSYPVCLCIVGGDISQPQSEWSQTHRALNALRKLLGLTASVTFVGQRPQHELPYYYNAAEMVVMPSHYESFGLSALEAMSCGVPVITTNVTGISSLIDEKHSSLITTVNNPLLLASQIEYFLHQPQKRNEVGSSLRKHVMDLSWDHIAKKMSAVYDSHMPGGVV